MSNIKTNLEALGRQHESLLVCGPWVSCQQKPWLTCSCNAAVTDVGSLGQPQLRKHCGLLYTVEKSWVRLPLCSGWAVVTHPGEPPAPHRNSPRTYASCACISVKCHDPVKRVNCSISIRTKSEAKQTASTAWSYQYNDCKAAVCRNAAMAITWSRHV